MVRGTAECEVLGSLGLCVTGVPDLCLSGLDDKFWGFSKLGSEKMAVLCGCPKSGLTHLERGPYYRICKPWPGCIEETPELGGVGY